MGLRSVVAIVEPGDSRRDHLSLNSREAALTRLHDLDIEPGRSFEDLGSRALNAKDVEDLPCPLDRGVVELGEQSLGGFRRDGLDTGDHLNEKAASPSINLRKPFSPVKYRWASPDPLRQASQKAVDAALT